MYDDFVNDHGAMLDIRSMSMIDDKGNSNDFSSCVWLLDVASSLAHQLL